jgi:hypothetical protein
VGTVLSPLKTTAPFDTAPNKFISQARFVDHTPNLPGTICGIVRAEIDSGIGTKLPVDRRVSSNHWQAGRHRFQQRMSERLDYGRIYKDVRQVIKSGYRFPI